MKVVDEEALLAKLVSQPSYTMTEDEAAYIWTEHNRMMAGNRKLQVLSLLNDHLTRELSKGKRCAVCGRAGDLRCIEEC